jgi:hypothetical protein
MSDFVDQYRADARLIILRKLAEWPDGSLSSKHLQRELFTFAVNEDREWVHEEMRYLAKFDAIRVSEAGSVLIGTITPKGRSHLARRLKIGGVDWPSEPIITE